MAKLDEKLNLIIPIERDGGTAYIHATPIAREAFEAHFRLLAATHADLFGRGGSYANRAPMIATLTLKDMGKREAALRGEEGDGGASALLAEIKRLSVVAHASGDKGWQLLPIDAAINRGVFDAEEWREAESAIVFFTLVWSMTSRRAAAPAVRLMAEVTGLSTTASPPSEWMSSLQRSTSAETSATPAASSSIPM